ncbi:hypothetical protein [Streptomyces sp. NPDC055287]
MPTRDAALPRTDGAQLVSTKPLDRPKLRVRINRRRLLGTAYALVSSVYVLVAGLLPNTLQYVHLFTDAHGSSREHRGPGRRIGWSTPTTH